LVGEQKQNASGYNSISASSLRLDESGGKPTFEQRVHESTPVDDNQLNVQPSEITMQPSSANSLSVASLDDSLASNVDPTEDVERQAMISDDGDSKASTGQIAKMAAIGRQLTAESMPSRPGSVMNDRKEIVEIPLKSSLKHQQQYPQTLEPIVFVDQNAELNRRLRQVSASEPVFVDADSLADAERVTAVTSPTPSSPSSTEQQLTIKKRPQFNSDTSPVNKQQRAVLFNLFESENADDAEQK